MLFLNEVFFYPSLEFSKHRWVNIFLYFLGAEGAGEIFFKYGDFYSRDIYARGMGIFSNLGISILGIGDFLKSWDFFKSWDFYPRILGIFLKSGDFYSGDWGFVKSWDFYPQDFCQIQGIFAKSLGFITKSSRQSKIRKIRSKGHYVSTSNFFCFFYSTFLTDMVFINPLPMDHWWRKQSNLKQSKLQKKWQVNT